MSLHLAKVPVYNLRSDELFKLFHCRRCGLFRLSKPKKALGFYYGPNYTPHQMRRGLKDFLYTVWASRMLALAKEIRPVVAAESKVLDVGCGSGTFLRFLKRRGFVHVSGLEPFPSAVKIARGTGYPIITATIEKWKPTGDFDLAFANNVLEHFHDPVLAAKNIFRALKPDGVLVGEVPNAGSVGFKILGRSWGQIAAPLHPFLFTPISLRKLLKEAGFKKVRILPSLNSSEWALGFDVIYRRRFSDRTPSLGTRFYSLFMLLSVGIEVGQYLLHLPTGHIRFVAKKV